MPLTLPTHPLAVLGVKLWRPRWFDGVALVLGATAPDLAFAADGYGPTIRSHAWHSPLWWALPVTLVGAPLVRWAAAPVAAHLPAGGPLALRDYGVLARVRHRWWVTATSAVLGAASHLAWDMLTHPTVDNGQTPLPALHAEPVPGWPWWLVVRHLSDGLGFVLGAVLVVHIGRSGALRRWHGTAPEPDRRRPVLFWTAATTVLCGGLALLPLQPVRLFHDQAVRALLVAGAALVAAAAVVGPVRAGGSRPGRPVRCAGATGAGGDVVGSAQHFHGDAAQLRRAP